MKSKLLSLIFCFVVAVAAIGMYGFTDSYSSEPKTDEILVTNSDSNEPEMDGTLISDGDSIEPEMDGTLASDGDSSESETDGTLVTDSDSIEPEMDGTLISDGDSIEPEIDGILVTEKVVEKIALDWASFVEPDLAFEITDIIGLYGYDDELCGYSVSYQVNNEPYGYVILDFSSENVVTEFVIENGVVNISETILEAASKPAEYLVDNTIAKKRETMLEATNAFAYPRKGFVENKKLYKLHPFEYSVSLKENGAEVLYSARLGKMSQGEFFSEREQVKRSLTLPPTKMHHFPISEQKNSDGGGVTPVSHYWDIMIDTIPSGFTTVDPLKSLSKKSTISEWDMEYYSKSYACVVQAMLNVADQNNLLINQCWTCTYKYLWQQSYTVVDYVFNDITYGWTYYDQMGPSLVALAKKSGKNNSIYSNNTAPTYDTFKNAVNAGKSSIFGSGVLYSNGQRVGHAVSVVGYRSAKDSSNNLYQYIYIADGWTNDFRYICINSTQYFTDKYSTVLTFQ